MPVKETYGLPPLWELLAENFPVQKHKIYLIVFETWNESNWKVERFLEAIPGLKIKISGCIMPDAKCYRQSKQRLEEMDEAFRDKCELVNKGLSAVNRVLEFPEKYSLSEKCTSTVPVEMVALDSYLDGEPVTFIKMDVEGAEMDVLLGMRETIMRYKPKLAICVYHQHEDIYDIPAYIQSLVPEYKFWLRHYSSDETETVLLCTI